MTFTSESLKLNLVKLQIENGIVTDDDGHILNMDELSSEVVEKYVTLWVELNYLTIEDKYLNEELEGVGEYEPVLA